jgi:hypothetical protein
MWLNIGSLEELLKIRIFSRIQSAVSSHLLRVRLSSSVTKLAFLLWTRREEDEPELGPMASAHPRFIGAKASQTSNIHHNNHHHHHRHHHKHKS